MKEKSLEPRFRVVGLLEMGMPAAPQNRLLRSCSYGTPLSAARSNGSSCQPGRQVDG